MAEYQALFGQLFDVRRSGGMFCLKEMRCCWIAQAFAETRIFAFGIVAC